MRKSTIDLADGRSLHYFGAIPARPDDYPDRRDLPRAEATPEVRFSELLGEWVIIASHRQDRTFRPADDQCPLCPSTVTASTEIPAPNYEVAVFENRFPALRGAGRCEVICFSQDHGAAFADLPLSQALTVMAAWVDRTAELSALSGVRQVYCFENRGREIGATLAHPHGQIYAYPYVTPVTSRMMRAASDYRQARGRNLFDDVVAAEQAEATRVVIDGAHWTAFVPYAARWPYEVHLYPRRRVPDLTGLTGQAMTEFCEIYLDLLRRFDRLFDTPAPYISGWHQAPVSDGSDGSNGGDGREEFALHLELFTLRRAPGKLKYLAASESGLGAFANDVRPEDAAQRLRSLA